MDRNTEADTRRFESIRRELPVECTGSETADSRLMVTVEAAEQNAD